MSAKNIQNSVIFQHLVKKNFASEAFLYQEVVGTVLAGMVGMSEQKVVLSSGCLMVEKVAGMTLSNLSEQMNDELKKITAQKLAEKLKKVKETFDKKKSVFKSTFGCLSFDRLIEINREKFLDVFDDPISLAEIEKMSERRDVNMTICHGDLNLSNIMLVGSELILIDFEHVTEAPMAFDLACSLLFCDEKSLDIKNVKSALFQMGILIPERELVLMTKLYLVDQLRKADKEKEQQLIKLARERKLI